MAGELKDIVEQYAQHIHLSRFAMDYANIRDMCLAGKPITLENLDAVLPRIRAYLELRLAGYKAAA